jgi:hypothetical protein
VNTAIRNGGGNTVLCFSSGSYGEIDIYAAHPSGIVTLKPASSAAATGIYFSLNGVSNVTITGFSGSSSSGGLLVQVTGQGNNSNITFSHNAMTDNGVQIQNNTLANANILIDSNTFDGFTTANESSRLNIVNDSGCPNGIIVSNNDFGGGRSDGMNSSGNSCGTQYLNNTIHDILEVNCNGIHCDGFQDNGGGVNLVLNGNFFYNVSNCWQITDGTMNLTMSNNVCVNEPGASHVGQIAPQTLLFKHNTITANLNMNIGNDSGGRSSSNITMTDNIFSVQPSVNGGQTVTGTFIQDYNLCLSGCVGAHSKSGSPTFSGGSSPTTYVGYALNPGSVGVNAGSDGKSLGINVAAQVQPPQPPTLVTLTIH